jgi:hypothetical protein
MRVACWFAVVVAIVAISSRICAQCEPAWIPGSGFLSPTQVAALTQWDPDGAGPEPFRLVAGGKLFLPSGQCTVAMWNGSSWIPVGASPSGDVNSLCVHEGTLVATGSEFVGNTNQLRVWQYSEQSGWTSLSSGLENGGNVRTSISWNGQLIVGGLLVMKDQAGASVPRQAARWTGTGWVEMGSNLGPGSATAWALAIHQGDLYLGGSFIGGGVARWNGNNWIAIGSGGTVFSLISFGGNLLASAAGYRQPFFGSVPKSAILELQGDTWRPLGGVDFGLPSNTYAVAMAAHEGKLYVAGNFLSIGNIDARGVAAWNGSTWESVGVGLTPGITALQSGDWGLAAADGFITIGSGRPWGQGTPGWARWTQSQPQVVSGPVSRSVFADGTLTLVVLPLIGFAEMNGGLNYRWVRNGTPLSNGPGGAAPGGGTVTGALGTMVQTQPLTLTINNSTPEDSGEYQLILENGCGTTASPVALVTVYGTCPGDFNVDGVVNDQDFEFFALNYSELPGNLCYSFSDPSFDRGCLADLNTDFFIGDLDFLIFAANYDALFCP